MLVDVETFFLDAGIHTKSVQFLDAVEEEKTASGCPEVDDENTEALSTEETPTASVEGTVACREQTCHQGTEDTANAVY